MSLLGVQAAVASLLRVPELIRGQSLEDFLKDFELDPLERKSVTELAGYEQTMLYGEELMQQRFEWIEKALVRTFHFVDADFLYDLWFEEFERTARFIEADHNGKNKYSLAFIDFLFSKIEEIQKREDVPPFFYELLAFEKAELELSTFYEGKIEPLQPKPEQMQLLFLDYDLSKLFTRQVLAWDLKKEEEKVPLLLVRRAYKQAPRLLKLNQDFASYLAALLQGELKPELYTSEKRESFEETLKGLWP